MRDSLHWLAPIQPEPFDVETHGSPDLRALVSIPADLLNDEQRLDIEKAGAWERNVHPRPQEIADLCSDLAHLVPDDEDNGDDPAGPFRRRGP